MAEASALACKTPLKDHVIKNYNKKLGVEARDMIMHRRQRRVDLSELGLALSTQ